MLLSYMLDCQFFPFSLVQPGKKNSRRTTLLVSKNCLVYDFGGDEFIRTKYYFIFYSVLTLYRHFVLQIYATIKSGSIAIAASTLDSLLDLMAGGILWFTHLSMTNINIYKYPIGKLRVQPVGIIIFAAIMATLGT